MSAPQHCKPEADYVSAPCTKPQLLHRAADKKQEATTNRQEAENCRQTTENSGQKIPA